jgi:hypothetical protein
MVSAWESPMRGGRSSTAASGRSSRSRWSNELAEERVVIAMA